MEFENYTAGQQSPADVKAFQNWGASAVIKDSAGHTIGDFSSGMDFATSWNRLTTDQQQYIMGGPGLPGPQILQTMMTMLSGNGPV